MSNVNALKLALKNTVTVFKCSYCNDPFPTFAGKNIHEYYCPKQNVTSRQDVTVTQSHEANSSALQETNEAPESNFYTESHDTVATSRQIVANRHRPHDEALGYDNTVLLNVASLSEMAREAIAKKKQNRQARTIANNSEDEIVAEDVDDEEDIRLDDIHVDQCMALESDSDDEDFVCNTVNEDIEEESDDDSWAGRKEPNVDGMTFENHEEVDPNQMPILYVAFVDLLWRLDHHKTDLNIFDDIIEWVLHFSRKHPGIFTSMSSTDKTTRKSVLEYLRRAFDRTRLKPTMSTVTLPSGRIVSMPVFPSSPWLRICFVMKLS